MRSDLLTFVREGKNLKGANFGLFLKWMKLIKERS